MLNGNQVRIQVALLVAGSFVSGSARADTLRVPGEFPTIQAAIDAAVHGDEVVIADGIYRGEGNVDVTFRGKAITVRSQNGPTTCIIDCQRDGRGFKFVDDETADSILAGLTITNGFPSGGWGGGIDVSSGSPTIADCVITDCIATRGGGINVTGIDAGPSIRNCVITRNRGASGGGGIYLSRTAAAIVANCRIFMNSTAVDGGGAAVVNGSASFINCVIYGNRAALGGGISVNEGRYWITNCTIRGNVADDRGGALFCQRPSTVNLTNSILRRNEAALGREIALDNGPTLTVSYSNVHRRRNAVSAPRPSVLQWDDGNINAGAQLAFVSDAHLMPGSPCIDAGTNDPPGGIAPFDLEGNPRILDGDGDLVAVADMGAYEFGLAAPAIALSTTAFQFHALLNQPIPGTQVFQIRNSGSGVLQWKMTPDCDWVEVEPASGVSSGGVINATVRVSHAGLDRGTHVCRVMISDPTAINSPRQIRISLRVNGELSVPSQFATIQEAVDAAFDGDTVVLADGVYTGVGNRDILVSKDVTIRSENGPEHCTIDCEEAGRAFELHAGRIVGLTMIRGFPSDADGGGAVLCPPYSPAPVALVNCVFRDNKAPDGGAIRAENDVEIVDCLFSDNLAEREPPNIGESCGGAISVRYNRPTVVGCRFEGNTADYGGAIHFEYGLRKVEDCIFVGNSALRGGAVYCEGGRALVDNCGFLYNTASAGGGGIYCDGGRIEIADSIIRGNIFEHEPGGAGISVARGTNALIRNCEISLNVGGGGISCIDGATLTVVDSIISYNVATAAEGRSGDGGGIRCSGGSATIIGCTVTDNQADYGGGIYARSLTGPTIISNCTIARNIAEFGGGITVSDSAEVRDCTIVDNVALDSSGGISASDDVQIQGCLIARNHAEMSGGGVSVHHSGRLNYCTLTANTAGGGGGALFLGSNARISNSILWGDEPDEILVSGNPVVAYCDIEGGYDGIGNISVDPSFVDPLAGDYHLQPDSRCIDLGDPDFEPEAGAVDLDGDPRLLGCIIDIGVDEVVDALLIDCNGNGTSDACDIVDGTSKDCNGNRVPDFCDVRDGTSADCNRNGIPDECDIAEGFSFDCDINGVPDECQPDGDGDGIIDACDNCPEIFNPAQEDCDNDGIGDVCAIAKGLSPDCNDNGLPDDCETFFTAISHELSPIGDGFPQQFVVQSPPQAFGDVILRFRARGDLGDSEEFITVRVNSVHARRAFIGDARDCPETPDSSDVIVPQAVFNDLASTGMIRIDMNPVPLVDPNQCDPPSFIQVTVRYPAFDCNENGVLDECDIAGGTSVDINGNGIPDECEPYELGDLNCDFAVDALDLEPFIIALFEPANYPVLYPDCDIMLADINGSGEVNSWDIEPFLALLFP